MNLVVASATEPLANLQLRCRFHAATGAVVTSSQPLRESSQGHQQPLLSATVSNCIPESSAAARRMHPVTPAVSSPTALAEAVPSPAMTAALRVSVTGAKPVGLAAISAGSSASSVRRGVERSAADSGLLLNPATLASAVQAQRSAVHAPGAVPGADCQESVPVLTAIDMFAPDRHSGHSPCESTALLVTASGPSSITARFAGPAVGETSQAAVQRHSIAVAGIRLCLASPSPQGLTWQPAAVATDSAGHMLYEVAWLADAVPPSGVQPLPDTHSDGDRAFDERPARHRTGHVMVAVNSRGWRSARGLRSTRHAAATAMGALEALQRFTSDVAVVQVQPSICASRSFANLGVVGPKLDARYRCIVRPVSPGDALIVLTSASRTVDKHRGKFS